ncbi:MULTISPECIES: XkdW family protein [Bacillus subtilis group]|uniref:XkdW family protein n=1 Tax=Bacillus subtilis group TaxID=653685 RepID=UPI00030398E4|nr:MULTISPECIES: XkdW family protein [Bacillus subtilis group]MEC0552337.1 XkdW family protein [Bacillus haynesii]KJH55724.1 phage portal protein [Bacillus licheniformis]MCY7775098.1 XkdW family protein [Bacillus licheniformis]MCY9286726.1 XkdW family protein [Bacillus licheniformis]MED0688702.1 XkdW family protein [Bacillus licheniformis]
MILYDAIMYKYPEAIPKKDFVLRNDGNGSYIEEWNLRAPIPTKEDLQLWWEESKKSQLYTPPSLTESLGRQLTEERLARKALEESYKLMGQELAKLKIQSLQLKGEEQQ